MQIVLNGEPTPLSGNADVASLLDYLGYTGKRVAVEVNQEIVPRSQYSEFQLNDSDRVEVVRAIGGG